MTSFESDGCYDMASVGSLCGSDLRTSGNYGLIPIISF